jgi:hypothetical protein
MDFLDTVWGLNNAGEHHKENSLLARIQCPIDKWAVYGRYEWVQKSSAELGLTTGMILS